MILSKIKIESFDKRCHMGTLGGKGLTLESIYCHRATFESYTNHGSSLLCSGATSHDHSRLQCHLLISIHNDIKMFTSITNSSHK